MCWTGKTTIRTTPRYVSVAGCLGYDVLAIQAFRNPYDSNVSVAGCLGYDVLVWLKTLI